MNYQKNIILQILIYLFCFTSIIWAQNYFHGKIERDTRWTGDVYIDGDVIIPRGVILSVEAGSHLHIKPNVDALSAGIDRERVEIVVDGVLLVHGRKGKKRVKISSMSNKPKMNDWYGIIIKNLYESSQIEFAQIEYAYKGITCYGSAPKISHSTIQYNHNAGISCEVRAKPEINTCQIFGNGFAGINCELASTPLVTNSEISQNAYGVLILTKSKPDLGRVPIRKNRSAGKNSIINNFDFDIYNHSIYDIYAQNNRWSAESSTKIRFKIFDKRDNSAYGKVLFEPKYGAYAKTQKKQNGRPYAENNSNDSLPSTTKASLINGSGKAVIKKNNKLLDDPFARLKSTKEKDTIYSYNIADKKQKKTAKRELREPILETQLDAGKREYINREKPVYPSIYLKTNTTGAVFIEVIVGRNGEVESYNVLKSEADLFTEAALDALQKFRYKPGTYRGFPVKFKIVELFRFKKD